MLKRNEEINAFFKNLLEEFKEFYTCFKISKNKDNCYFGFKNTKNYIVINFYNYKIKRKLINTLENRFCNSLKYKILEKNKKKHKLFLFLFFLIYRDYAVEINEDFMRIKNNINQISFYIKSNGKIIDIDIDKIIDLHSKELIDFENSKDIIKNRKRINKLYEFAKETKKEEIIQFKYIEKNNYVFLYNVKNKTFFGLNNNFQKKLKEKIEIFLEKIKINKDKKNKILINQSNDFYTFVYLGNNYSFFKNFFIHEQLTPKQDFFLKNYNEKIIYKNKKYYSLYDKNQNVYNDLVLIDEENQKVLNFHINGDFSRYNNYVYNFYKDANIIKIKNEILEIKNNSEIEFRYYKNLEKKDLKFTILNKYKENTILIIFNSEIYIVKDNFELLDLLDKNKAYKNLSNNFNELIKENNKCKFMLNF
ncbi:hypothetical protein [Fusobacterium polymorphum]|uniref:Uncharacterized protein n=1 Tax=Fusobacterium nucleatum subsp. polymorphum TaxID=76857 RepID=A0A2C6AWU4_FUSNP|nr:hypothetical protein [Fusobacterium polymorphum]PHI06589.1 hypothetical protein CBG54_05860 [Fusobacterium polymorphum]